MSFIHANDAAMGDLGYERREADFYPTPAWCSEAVIPYLHMHGVYSFTPIWECAAGMGDMSEVLKQHFPDVVSTDLFNYGYEPCKPGVDFLKTTVDFDGAIVTNPPYGDLAEQFIRHGIERTRKHEGVLALLMRNEYDCAKGRSELFINHPFARKVVLTTRPRWIPDSTGAPRHNYAWFIWDHKWADGPPAISYHVRKGKE
jgi:hypothetical protein